ncbi:MAG: hypothetical protein Q8M99_09890 [Methylotenera sp.]|nr:hypothetical protein [Methylotenera sp.]
MAINLEKAAYPQNVPKSRTQSKQYFTSNHHHFGDWLYQDNQLIY